MNLILMSCHMYLGLIVLVFGMAMMPFSFGIINSAYASHDPEQPQYHSIILPPDMKEKNFDEFMEWCVPKLGDKCAELYEKNNVSSLLSPLKQFKSGVPIEKIQCRDSLILVTKHDGSPACIKPESSSGLVQRDWIQSQFSFCGADGFDSKDNLNKSNSTHFWDENYCKWWPSGYDPSLHQEEKEQLQMKKILEHCNRVSLGLETDQPYLQYENQTHIITNDTCEWRKMHLR